MKFNPEIFPSQEPQKVFSIEKEIDGLVYYIDLVQDMDNLNSYALGFVADGMESLTNKGLGTFNKVIDEISSFVEKIRLNQKVDMITFSSSKETNGERKLQ